jgi:hypothetical protein
VPRGGVEPPTLRFSEAVRTHGINGLAFPLLEKQAGFGLWMAKGSSLLTPHVLSTMGMGGPVMATTVYFEEVLEDEAREHKAIALEFGTMTALRNGGNLYIRIDGGDAVLVERKTAKKMLEGLEDALAYLGIRR